MLVNEVDQPIAHKVTVRAAVEKGRNDVWFAIHGGDVEVLEGAWPGHVVLIEFPDRDSARAWYRSPAYQSIVRLRTNNS